MGIQALSYKETHFSHESLRGRNVLPTLKSVAMNLIIHSCCLFTKGRSVAGDYQVWRIRMSSRYCYSFNNQAHFVPLTTLSTHGEFSGVVQYSVEWGCQELKALVTCVRHWMVLWGGPVSSLLSDWIYRVGTLYSYNQVHYCQLKTHAHTQFGQEQEHYKASSVVLYTHTHTQYIGRCT